MLMKTTWSVKKYFLNTGNELSFEILAKAIMIKKPSKNNVTAFKRIFILVFGKVLI